MLSKMFVMNLTGIMAGLDIQKVLEACHIQGDVGSVPLPSVAKTKRKNIKRGIFCQRAACVKESLRVLEEVAKLIDSRRSSMLKLLRYKVYALEQKAIGLC